MSKGMGFSLLCLNCGELRRTPSSRCRVAAHRRLAGGGSKGNVRQTAIFRGLQENGQNLDHGGGLAGTGAAANDGQGLLQGGLRGLFLPVDSGRIPFEAAIDERFSSPGVERHCRHGFDLPGQTGLICVVAVQIEAAVVKHQGRPATVRDQRVAIEQLLFRRRQRQAAVS